jgi:hypothetical protein
VALPILEVPTGAIDGVNQTFTTSQPYGPGNIRVFLNGLLQRRDFVDGWFETDPAAGRLTLKEAPRSTDVVQVYYMPVTSAGCDESSEPVGVLYAISPGLRGMLGEPSSARAGLVGEMQVDTPLRAKLKSIVCRS